MVKQSSTGSVSIPSVLPALIQLATQANQGFFLYSLRTRRFDSVNPGFQNMWGVNREDFTQASLIGAVHPEDRGLVRERYREFLSGKGSKRVEFRLLLPDGSVKWLSLLAYYLFEGTLKSAVVGFIEEITARKARESAWTRHNDRNRAVLEMLSHDLKGSLAIISAMNGELKERARLLDDQQAEKWTGVIEQLCSSSMQLIHSLLETELLDSAGAGLSRKRLDLVEHVQGVLSHYQHPERPLDRDFRLAGAGAPVYAEVDEVLFSQLLHNLISNAVKFTRDGGSILVSLEEDRERVLVSVRDDGVGIPRHLQPALFDRFTSARRPGIRGEESTGLGMSIVKRIVGLHGGRVWVESGEGEGTSVFFSIPKTGRVNPCRHPA